MRAKQFFRPIKNGVKACKDTPNAPCWSVKEFSELKGVNYDTLRSRISKSQLIPIFTKNRKRYYSIHDLNEWYESNWLSIDSRKKQ
jgi:hypothetical protein